MDVLVLTKNDYANTGYRITECLKSLGLDVVAFKGRSHIFEYPNQIPVHQELFQTRSNCKYPTIIQPNGHGGKEIKALMEQTKVIHFMASTYADYGADITDKKIIVSHGGNCYRKNPQAVNNFFGKITDATIIQCPDLLGLGAPNEHLIYYPVQTDVLRPNYGFKHQTKLFVGHFPSSPYSKGTKNVIEAINNVLKTRELSDKFMYFGPLDQYTIVKKPWKEHLNRVNNCDVIIETINPDIEGDVFGEWGNAALEAAALGKIVITNSLKADIYKKEYGDLRLLIANNREELEEKLKWLLELKREQIYSLKVQTRKWVEKNHSMESTSKRLWDKVYKYLV